MRRASAVPVSGAIFLALLCIALATVLAAPAWSQPAPNLSITKGGPERVEPGRRFTYTIDVRNTGDANATAVQVIDRLPPAVQYVAFEPASAGCTPPPGTADAQNRRTVTCNLGVLAPNATRNIELIVRAPSGVRTIENRARVESADTDPRDSNIVRTRVAPRLVINKLDDPDPARVGDALLYTLRVQNTGAATQTGIGITDDLPLDALDFVTVDSANFDCEFRAGIVRCVNGELARGEVGKVEVVVEPERAGTLRNTAAVRFGEARVAEDTETTRVERRGGGDNGGGDGGDGGNGGGNGNNGNGNNGNGNGGDGDGNGNVESLQLDELECEELLREFRSSEGEQYGDASEFATADVRDRVLVCLERETIRDTATDGQLPETGGLSLLGLAALGLVSVVAGASVVRGAGRDQ